MVSVMEPIQDMALREGHDALNHLSAQRHEISQVHTELRGAVASLRRKSDALRGAVKEAVDRVHNSSLQVLEHASEAEQQRRHIHPTDGLSGAEQAVSMLEHRLGVLRLEEGERQRAAELRLLQREMQEQALLERVEAVESAEAEAGADLTSRLPLLQAEIATAEFDLMQAQETARKNQTAPQYTEWHRMLMEDKPQHVGLGIVEAMCDSAEKGLHSTLDKAVGHYSGQVGRQGLERLNHELHSVAATVGPPSSAECFKILSAEGPWRLVFSELRDTFKLIEELRSSNDEMSGDITLLRWRRAGFAQPTSDVVSDWPLFAEAKRSADACSSATKRGPQFEAPLPGFTAGTRQHRPIEDFEKWPSMRRPVTSDLHEWQASSQPPQLGDEAALGFLHSNTDQRFRPATAPLPGFESSWGFDEPPESLLRPATSEEVQSLGTIDLARLAQEAFQEPLSAAVGGQVGGRYQRHPARASKPRTWPRPDWVTFNSSSPPQAQLPSSQADVFGGCQVTPPPLGSFGSLDGVPPAGMERVLAQGAPPGAIGFGQEDAWGGQ
eukprot:CAMPEP_0178450138 /NCGR_PEP_ID=MMETSP0689_2-20121128/42948_1 /TAXON_ID=160604 /ORGANISM="Amphidinium massartii, Strain CS-259" /LENGTH=552 /DNA_ID=CAMNT_0020075551 /DNA_START=18 /DNA_END=1673 /DNA_ORIENTATION=+